MSLDEFFEDGELTELLHLATGDRLSTKVYWNFDNDPLLDARASGTMINFLCPTSTVSHLDQNDLAIRSNGDRFRIRSLEPTCGDGELTQVNVNREKV